MSKKPTTFAIEDPDYKYDVRPNASQLNYARELLNVPGQFSVPMLAECFAKVAKAETIRVARLSENKKHAKSK